MNTFKIAIQRQFEGSWPIVVEFRSTDDLNIHTEGMFQFSAAEFEQLIELQDEPEEYGTLLGKRLFREEVRDALIIARSKAPTCLRVLLSIEVDKKDPLRTLHWERLCAPTESGTWNYLALDRKLPFSQYIPTSVDRLFPPIGRRNLRALILVASPENSEQFKLTPFDVEATVAGVRSALGNIPCDVLGNGVEGAIGAPTLDNLCEQLTSAQHPYTLLHIVCHGRLMTDEEGDTVLYWATAKNQVEPVPGKQLLKRLRQCGGKNGLPHLTFLSTCESADPRAEGALGGLAQRLVRDLAMPAVVAMTRKVSVETALTLGQRFYQRLRESGEVDLALQEATAGLGSRRDIVVPALFSRLGGRPLFSDTLDRDLTDEDIKFGLERLLSTQHEAPSNPAAVSRSLIERRAPVLLGKVKSLKTALEEVLKFEKTQLTGSGKRLRDQALYELNELCSQVLSTQSVEFNFNALALDRKLPDYDDRCPFPGLASFAEIQYHEFFFGRDELIQELQTELKNDKFLAVLGPSGSGKSSLVLAGLIPKLQQQDPRLVSVDLKPGDEPLKQLQVSIASVAGQTAVFVVDQFEELFTLCTDNDKRNAFIDELLNLAQQQQVIITMRTDFLGECQFYSKLSKRIEARLKLIGPMKVDELGKAMTMQADKVGLEFETGLSNAILAEVEGEPGAMPLLQYALRELWNRRQGRWLCCNEYEAIGRVRGAIATTATEFYNKLSEKDLTENEHKQKQVRHIFEQLTRVDEDFDPSDKDDMPKDTRRRVELNQLITAKSDLNQTKALVTELANVRLVITKRDKVTKKDEVEVAHEALILHWPLLQEWLTESRPRLKLQQQMRPTIQRWQSTQDDGELLRGGLLQTAGDYLEKFPDAFSQEEKVFIQASQELPRRKPKLPTVLRASFAVAAIVSIARIFGLMMPLELAAYDQMMQHKPDERQDGRILIVGINDDDIRNKITGTGEGPGTLRDRPLQQFLQKMQQYQPSVIGLDIARDFPATRVDPLLRKLTKQEVFVGICTLSEGTSSGRGIRYPMAISAEQAKESVGFSNFIESDNENIRRQPLLNPVVDKEFCPTESSFSYAIARRYLKTKGKLDQAPTAQQDKYDKNLKLGETLIPRRTGLTGGYQGDVSEPATYQVLLNYRSYQGNPSSFAEQISLKDILQGDANQIAEKVKDKIVIIGFDSEYSAPDIVFTPFGKVSGPIVQGQMVSQIISAVLDNRPLIWWWPIWADALWIGFWALAGGLIVWCFRQPLYWVIGGVSLASLIGICWAVFAYQSGWLPLIPAIFAFIGAAGSVAWITFKLRQGNSRKNRIQSIKKPGLMPEINLPKLFRQQPN
jgi:CHASE2 domain-containing sensor protein/energy-coupling factor transporter ATP-binding protein EcfA2